MRGFYLHFSNESRHMNKSSAHPRLSHPALHEATKGSTASGLHRHHYPALISLFIRCTSTLLFIVWIHSSQGCRQGSDGLFQSVSRPSRAYWRSPTAAITYAHWKHKIIDEHQDERKWIDWTFAEKNLQRLINPSHEHHVSFNELRHGCPVRWAAAHWALSV